MQSEKMKEVQPQLEKLEKKYKDKTSEEDQKKKAQEAFPDVQSPDTNNEQEDLGNKEAYGPVTDIISLIQATSGGAVNSKEVRENIARRKKSGTSSSKTDTNKDISNTNSNENSTDDNYDYDMMPIATYKPAYNNLVWSLCNDDCYIVFKYLKINVPRDYYTSFVCCLDPEIASFNILAVKTKSFSNFLSIDSCEISIEALLFFS